MYKARVIIIAAIASLASLLASLGLAYGAFWYTVSQQEHHKLDNIASTALQRVNRAFNNSRELLGTYAQQDIMPCSPEHIEMMRTGILAHPDIEEIGFMQGDTLACSSWGVVDKPVQKQGPDFVTQDGMLATVGVKPQSDKNYDRIALQYGPYSALLNPETFHEPAGTAGLQLAILTHSGIILSMVNISDTAQRDQLPQLLELGHDNSTAAPDTTRLYSVASDSEFAIVASEPRTTFIDALDNYHAIIIIIGSMLAAVMTGCILWIARKQFSPAAMLAKAVRNREFIVHYQPIVDLATRRCTGAEALVRWQKDDGALVHPDQFINEAEQCELILPITDQIIDMVTREMATFLSRHPDMHIAINISAHDMKTGRILPVLNDALRRTGIARKQIWLEVTERGFMDIDAARTVIDQARNAGYHVAIDDFGTGYSSLSHLQGLPLDTLKIDKSFVDSIDDANASGNNIASHIIAMAQSLGMSIVAEGIEKAHQATYLASLHVEFGQGWLFSQPLPANEFIAYCHQHDTRTHAAGQPS